MGQFFQKLGEIVFNFLVTLVVANLSGAELKDLAIVLTSCVPKILDRENTLAYHKLDGKKDFIGQAASLRKVYYLPFCRSIVERPNN